MWKLGFIFIIPVIFLTADCVFLSVCGPHEYLTDQHTCCPKCDAGSYVLVQCDRLTLTACVPCPPSTYTDEPSGLLQCKSCSDCESELGLKVKRACSPTSDTLCEPLKGHWCTDPNKNGCRRAVEHTRCSPGQYIKQKGTVSSDTTCEACTHGTFSDGRSTSCWTQYARDTEERVPKREPSSSMFFSPNECDKAIIGVIIALVSFMATLILTFVDKSPKRSLQPVMFTLVLMGMCGVLCSCMCELHHFCLAVSVLACVGMCVCVCAIRLCHARFVFCES